MRSTNNNSNSNNLSICLSLILLLARVLLMISPACSAAALSPARTSTSAGMQICSSSSLLFCWRHSAAHQKAGRKSNEPLLILLDSVSEIEYISFDLLFRLYLGVLALGTTADVDHDTHLQHPQEITSNLTTTTTTSWQNGAVIIDSHEEDDDDARPITPIEDHSSFSTHRTSGPMIFFSTSLSIFAAIGILIFCRKCVRCPPVTGHYSAAAAVAGATAARGGARGLMSSPPAASDRTFQVTEFYDLSPKIVAAAAAVVDAECSFVSPTDPQIPTSYTRQSFPDAYSLSPVETWPENQMISFHINPPHDFFQQVTQLLPSSRQVRLPASYSAALH